MPDNRLAVYGRTHNSLKRLKTNPEKLNLTLDVMQKYISAGHVEEIPTFQSTPPPRKSWYIPVFPVSHLKKKKVRIVFDSSACYNGTSLNQQLLQGPDVNNLLRTVLFRFRLSSVGFCADVETMFHNFELQLEHRDFTRFFWFSENNPENSIAQFRATRHVFGNTSSPSLANIGLRFAISNASPRLPPEAEDFVFSNFYVDDGLASCDSPEQAIKILKHTKAALQQFNIRLCKICSNDISVMAAFPPTECNISPDLIPLNNDLLQSTLGISWNTSRDELIVQTSVPERPFNKRGVLATINSIFDPLGIASLIVLSGRLIQRKLIPSQKAPNPLTEKLGWDDPLPTLYQDMWVSWKASLNSSSQLSVPRSYIPQSFGPPTIQELHAFGDASDFGNRLCDIHSLYQSSWSRSRCFRFREFTRSRSSSYHNPKVGTVCFS